MKKQVSILRNYFNSKKHFIIGISILLIGIIVLGSSIVFNSRQTKNVTFRTISYDEEATASGEIAGAFDEIVAASPSPTLKVYNRRYISPTVAPTQTRSPTATRSTSTTTSGPSGSSNTASTTSTSNPTATSTTAPQATGTPTPTSEPVSNTPTPTAPSPTPQATPTPGFGASINTSVDGDTLKVTVEANRPLKVCVIHYLKEVSGAFVPAATKNPTPDGNKCSADDNKSEIKKIKAYIASSDGETSEIERSGPFE